MALWVELLLMVALILVSGVFAGAEIALLSVRKTRLAELAEEGRRGAKSAVELRRDPERLLATIQIAITVLGAATAVFGGARLEHPLAGVLTAMGLHDDYAEPLAFVLVVSAISYLSLVLGELVPKSLALRKSEAFSLLIARGLLMLSRVTRPGVWILTFSSNLVLRIFRDSTTFTESKLSSEELQQLVEEASAAGSLPPAAGEIASRAIDLAGLRVKDVMIPRPRVIGLAAQASKGEVRDVLQEHPHSRYPVYEGSIDNVLGYVTAREVYEAIIEHGSLDLRALMRPVIFIPATTAAVQVVRKLQQQRQRLGMVVDETGGVLGVVTTADVTDELIGELLDEHDAPERLIVREEDGTFLVRGEAPIHEVERALDTSLSTDDVRASTVAGLVIEELGRIPEVGEHIVLGSEIDAEIVEASERRVRALRLRRIPIADET
jgi:putative hemolysin